MTVAAPALSEAPNSDSSSFSSRLVLPRARALTETLLDAQATSVSSAELAGVRDHLVSELEKVVGASDVPSTRIASYQVLRFLEGRDVAVQGEAVTRPEKFRPTPASCRRAVGVAAVERCLRRRASAPAVAVGDVLDGAIENLNAVRAGEGGQHTPWWAEWYSDLSSGARSVVMAEAITWATNLWTALDWELLGRRVVVGGSDDWWQCPGLSRIVLQGRADIRVFCAERQAMLIVGSSSPPANWRPFLGFPALVSALVRGERTVPARVVGTWPTSGLVRVCEVDAAALAEAAEAVVGALRATLAIS